MPRRRKKFPCGHQGYGQVCHYCAQLIQAKALEVAEREQARLAQEQARLARQEWEASFANDVVDLQGLPKWIVLKARQVIAELLAGADYRQFKGKRLNHDRRIISIPLSYNYRLICYDTGDRIEPRSVLSHEAYNVKKPLA
ncbi:hypothetical protein MZ909_06040 [Thermosynechococcus sp. B0]|uniref:DUF7682 family zinc-binding protein n=1 Tax=unclassified Thermosynechococcus TaxID=2622553 RepID=UPI00122E5B65|nr:MULTISPECIES: hypothetical protein [unclassified Thermosynechococcus]QEQ00976.1 hypothetical protein FFX45_06020 [Thermosynechococcus sp. CL-1]WJI25240.1 hypothetical protein MZ909_06040 [Thermosynechococcus sp. B0]WKT84884.1 hypothetical protein QYC28_06060 [Thermosynechococcus sp. HY596]WNC64018.1 hypothetical protein RHK13_06055 [Thermosynechococcus sp. HY591]WNC66583.1 hypothetical protein RHK28_06080 [Thermosynechococcus sp. HY593]